MKGHLVFPRLLPLLLLLVGSAALDQTGDITSSEADVRAILLQQRGAFKNWEAFARANNVSGWDAGSDICSWTGVWCHDGSTFETSSSFSIYLSCHDDDPDSFTKVVSADCGAAAACNRRACSEPRLQGTLMDGLARIGNLQTLDLHGQRLTGTLPPAWASFPNLVSLDLGQNTTCPSGEAGCRFPGIGGPLPPAWAKLGATVLVLGPNSLSGDLPAEWAALPNLSALNLSAAFAPGGSSARSIPAEWLAPTALNYLSILDLSWTQLQGSLPTWQLRPEGSNPALISVLRLRDNSLQGGLPAQWGNASYYASGWNAIDLSANALTGTLPREWTGDAFASLVALEISNNMLSGSLPPSWGGKTFDNLLLLDLANNKFTGSIPPAWAPEAGAFPALAVLNVSGNGMCGEPPPSFPRAADPGLGTFKGQVCGSRDPNNTCLAPSCSAAPTPPGYGAGDAEAPPSNSSAPVGAIVGGVVGGLAALAVLAFLALRPDKGWLRRSRAIAPKGQLQPGPSALGKQRQHQRSLDSICREAMEKDDLSSCASPATTGTGSGSLGAGTGAGSRAGGSRRDPVLDFIASNLDSMRQRAAGSSRNGPPGAREASGSGTLRAADGALPADGGSGQLDSLASRGMSQRSSQLSAEIQQWEVEWEHLSMQRSIGKGSYGRVYLARLHETEVACKLLLSEDECRDEDFLLPPEVLRDLHAEAAIMVRMRHPHVVQFMGICALPPCLVTEYCARGSVFDVLRQGLRSEARARELTWTLRLQMALDAAKGLLYLHKHSPPIIHRDVKSPNLLVNEHWRVKIADFNLSKVLQPHLGAAQAQASEIATNPMWVAPEAMAGRRPTAASDVYSFGLVLLELLTWRLPWGEDSEPYQIIFQLMQGERPDIPPLEELPGPDPQLLALSYEPYCQLIRDCWAQDPGERPTFDQVVPRLRELLEALRKAVRDAKAARGTPSEGRGSAG